MLLHQASHRGLFRAVTVERLLPGSEFVAPSARIGSASAGRPREFTAGKLTSTLSHRMADVHGRQWTAHWSHSTCDSKVATQVDARCAASRGNDIERREVGLETAGVPGQQWPTLDGGVGSDEEVGQHLPLAAAAPAV